MFDALTSHTIPMWNPLMQYGSPWYSYVGMPVWYTFTLILACFGYTPVTIAISFLCYAYYYRRIGGTLCRTYFLEGGYPKMFYNLFLFLFVYVIKGKKESLSALVRLACCPYPI